MIHRRNEFRGEDTLVKALESKDNVEMVFSSKVVKLEGEARLESIGVENIEEFASKNNNETSGLQAAECTQDNEIKVEKINDAINNIRNIEVAGLFIAIGQVPSNEVFSNIIKLDDYGYIVATENCKTNIDGVFVAGDCRTKKVRQLTTAAADGAIAGLAACEYIG